MSTRAIGLLTFCPLTLSLIILAATIPSLAAFLEVKTSHGVSYMSGGVGEDEREALRALGQRSTLKLIFAQKEGNYLSDVAVSIRDRAGRPMLDAIADGPFLFANLPPGQYSVTATSNGVTQQQQARVTTHHQKQLAFYW